jgi:hypothetical protein
MFYGYFMKKTGALFKKEGILPASVAKLPKMGYNNYNRLLCGE